MTRRFLFFAFGALISIFLLSMGPENRLKKTFYAYIDYFSMDKRVIWHLENNTTIFSTKSECQLVYYSLSKEELLSVLEGGEVNFEKSNIEKTPCQFYVIENSLNEKNLAVSFKFCDAESTVEVMGFTLNSELEICDF
ncbi:MAG: hypothetical protein CBC83_03870 [Flavobacteriales bacterium TMED123]|nr:MAG: hypothetical protein CBC83_03870 [Flavobacteriales bacterium TMED123]